MTMMEKKPVAGVFLFGPYRLNAVERTLVREGSKVILGSRAFDLLVALVQRQGAVLSRRELMEFAWSGLSVEDSNVRVQIARLRREIGCGDNGIRYIASVSGRGYSFVAPVEWSEEGPPQSVRVEGSYGLPPLLKRALGREDNVVELSQALRERRFVTVVGAGGVGKTTLVTLVAHRLRDFSRIYFVDLGTLETGALINDAVASAIGVPSTDEDTQAGITDRLSGAPTLMILDNCEHVIDAVAELVQPALRASSNVHFLLTSREALRLPGEAVYLLRPLGAPPHTGRLTAKQALFWPAVELFMERAADGGHHQPLGDEQAATVAAICRRLDGNPLAIELVASRVGTYGLDRVAELLDDRLSLCWRGSRNAVPRHQTVEAMLDWSYALLSEKSQKVLHRLSIFSGEFSLDAAEAVAGGDDIGPSDISGAIVDLVDKSLLAFQGGTGPARLKLLGITRTYAALKLAQSDENTRIRGKHALLRMQNFPQRASSGKLPFADTRHRPAQPLF